MNFWGPHEWLDWVDISLSETVTGDGRERKQKEQAAASGSVTRKSNLSCKVADVGCSGRVAAIVHVFQRPGRREC